MEYHSVECGVLSYLEPSRCLGRLPHLALRIITKTGLQNLIRHTQTPLPNRDQVDPGLFDPTSYRSVHNLAANTEAIFVLSHECLKIRLKYSKLSKVAVQTTV